MSRYRFIAAEKATYPVSLLCRVLGVSRASFYAWRDRGPSVHERTDAHLLHHISRIHRGSRGTYGAPRVHAELRQTNGLRVGRKRVARLLRAAGLVGCHRRRRRGLTRPDPQATPPADLVGRLFDPGAPDRTWFADISYIPTREGWLYLAAVMDGYSRRVVGSRHGRASARRAGRGRPADGAATAPARPRAHLPQRPRQPGWIQPVVATPR